MVSLSTSFNPLAGIDWYEFRQAYRTFQNNPTQGIFHIMAAERNSNWDFWVRSRLARQASHLENVLVEVDIAALSQMPPTTLGGAYAKHIISQGLDPEVFVKSNADGDWLNRRMGFSHDIHHVLTGFDGTPAGEFGLAAFVLLQYGDLLNVFVLSFAPWFAIGYPRLIPKLVVAIFKGLKMGFTCNRPVIGYPFEENWHKPLNEIRQELGIAR